MGKILLSIGALLIITLAVLAVWWKPQAEEVYDPSIDPSTFTSTVDNPFFTLTPGSTFVYEAQKGEGKERIEVTVLDEERTVMGVKTVVVRDQVFLDGELIEDTNDWYAQDREGNVWYFGEETAEYEDGVVTTTEGSWEASVDGAKPGIIMKAHPQVGDTYRQEYYKGEAEDMADVIALNESVTTPYGSFAGCLKTYDYTPLNPKAKEYKFYCKEIGNVVLEVDIEDNERAELISVVRGGDASTMSTSTSASPKSTVTPTLPKYTTPPAAPPPVPTKEITEGEARSIALARVSGKVTDVAIETKFGKKTYVIEIKPTYGAETDVFIDIQTGEILAVE